VPEALREIGPEPVLDVVDEREEDRGEKRRRDADHRAERDETQVRRPTERSLRHRRLGVHSAVAQRGGAYSRLGRDRPCAARHHCRVGDGPEPLGLDDERSIEELGAALRAADFTVERLESTLQTHEVSSRPVDTLAHLRRLTGDDPFSTLTAHFVLGAPVGASAMETALTPIELDRFLRLRLSQRDGDELRPLVRLVPHGDYYIASDLERGSETGPPSDFVPGIQAPTVTLAKLAVRRPVDAALDLGTGCGIQALLAAKHSGTVVASDINPRAVRFAAFNLRLNSVDNVELREGNGFDALEPRRFGLLVSNPPYVISPDSTYLYRDSGLRGDELCRRLVEQAPAFLEEGGFAHFLVSWAHEQEEWAAPLRDWVSGSGCDAWLLHFGSHDPVSHAANWLRPLAESDAGLFAEGLDRWLTHLKELGFEAIGYGAVVLRRRSGVSNWVREDVLPLDRLEAAGEHTQRIFAAQDFLDGLGDDGLLRARLALADSDRFEQTLIRRDGGLAIESQTLRLVDGFGFTVGVDRYTAALVPLFDGEAALSEVLAKAASSVELDDDERERFVPAALPVVRRLLELGFLVPAPS
jgi:Methyltransferase small domain